MVQFRRGVLQAVVVERRCYRAGVGSEEEGLVSTAVLHQLGQELLLGPKPHRRHTLELLELVCYKQRLVKGAVL